MNILLNFFNNHKPQKTEAILKDPSQSLPTEIFSRILWLIEDDADILNAQLVSKNWKLVTIETQKRKEFNKLKQFLNFLSEKLPNEENLNIKYHNHILESANLLQIKFFLSSSKDRITSIFNDLDEENLLALQNSARDIEKPKSFEKIFEGRIMKAIRDGHLAVLRRLLELNF